MARITDTPLFKSVAPRIKSISKKGLAKQLAIAKRTKDCRIIWEEHNLIGAFVWSTSPQDFDFWNKLHKESFNNGI